MLKIIKGAKMKSSRNSRQFFLSFKSKYIGKYLFIRMISDNVYEYFTGDENMVVPENVKKYKISMLKTKIKKGDKYFDRVKGMAFFYNKVEYEYAVVDYRERRIYFFTNIRDAFRHILSKFTNPDLIDMDKFLYLWENYNKNTPKTIPNVKKFIVVFIAYSNIYGIMYDINRFVEYFFVGNMKKFRNFLSRVRSKYEGVFKRVLEQKHAEVSHI